MARLLALCLLLIGLTLLSAPLPGGAMAGAHHAAAEEMPAAHHGAAIPNMADCADCPDDAIAGGEPCQGMAGCAAGTLAMAVTTPDWRISAPGRTLRHAARGIAPDGASPPPLLGPPRRLI